jgi:segregation and condensation protein A
MPSTDSPYQIRLEAFEGPLDLLLHLIKKNEINIYDIPIALITQQYLNYLSVMTSLNLTVAGDFLVMAATLVQIKSRMLLPVDETEAEGEDGPDPREELVRRLLEYKQFKDAAGRLDERERRWRDIFYRSPSSAPVAQPDEPVEDVTLFDLVDALHAILARTPNTPLLEISFEHLTVKDRMNAILERLEGNDSITFASLFQESHRLSIIVSFLALLELIRIRLVRVVQPTAFGPILIMRAFSPVPEQELHFTDHERRDLPA